jgi:hypothetical protein
MGKADAMKFLGVCAIIIGGFFVIETIPLTSEGVARNFCAGMQEKGHPCTVDPKKRSMILLFDTHIGLLTNYIRESNYCLRMRTSFGSYGFRFDPGWRLNVIDVDGEPLVSCRLA